VTSPTDGNPKLQRGNQFSQPAEFAATMRTYGPAVYRVAFRILLDHGLAEDVSQEIFERLWNTPERFSTPKTEVGAMLVVQARYLAIDVVRNRTARKSREATYVNPDTHGIFSSIDGSPQSAFEPRHIGCSGTDSLRAALNRLCPKQRTVIERAYFTDVSYRQVAVDLHLPEGTVKARIRAGLRTLKTTIAESEIEAEAA
jgi:RNA polymerase sigma-70 factor, ECF subfamily